jgi:hypothetical protein
MEPGAESAHRGIEHCAGTQRTANALRENDLVVFGGDGGHHQAEDMEERATKEDPTRTIVVIKLAKDGTLCQVSECHSSSGRGRTYAHEHGECFQRRNPSNRAGRVGSKLVHFIVVLEHANTFSRSARSQACRSGGTYS